MRTLSLTLPCLLLCLLPAEGRDGPPYYDKGRKTKEQEEAAEKAGKQARSADAAEAVELLGDPSVWVRDEAFLALEEREDEALLRGLIPHLLHQDLLTRTAVAELLGRRRFKPAREALEKVAREARDEETALEAIWALRELEQKSSGPVLQSLYEKKHAASPYRVRGDALRVLARVDPERARPLIEGALRHDVAPLRIAGLLALGELDETAALEAAVDVLSAAPVKKGKEWERRLLDAALSVIDGANSLSGALLAKVQEVASARGAREDGLQRQLLHETLAQLAGGEAGEGSTRVRFHGVPIHSKRVAFAQDVSSGMSRHKVIEDEPESPTRLVFATTELQRVLGALDEDVLTNVVFFATRHQALSPKLLPNKKVRKKLPAFVRKAAKTPEEPGMSRSNVYDMLEAVLADPQIDTVYLLSEGAPSEGRFQKRERFFRHLERLNAYARVRIHVIQVAEGGKRTRFLKGLSESGRGSFYDLDFLKRVHGL